METAKGIVDLHSHILPDIDEGDLRQTIQGIIESPYVCQPPPSAL
jgi:hypothetical protein